MIIKQVSFEPGVSAWVFDQQAASAGDFLISQAAIDNFPGTWHIDIEGDSFGVSSIVLTSEGVNDTLSFLIFRVGQLVRLFALENDVPDYGRTFGALNLALADAEYRVRSVMAQYA